MVPLYDNELNLDPRVAAALRSRARRANVARPIRNARVEAQPRHAPPARRNGLEVLVRILSWLFGTAAVFVTAVLVVAILGWLYSFTLTAQPGQLSASGAPITATAGTTH